MSLKNWLNNGWLTEHRTSAQEITALLAVADRDLSGMVSDQEAKEMMDLAARLRLNVEEWLRKTHPQLLVEQKKI
ncbi:MAG: hypothetical protein H8D96_00645 [Desulfobacterales bacterium]|uniref:Uncharacterized protein n=1 Tax=Candidatus Desulfatibia vada TaxID=2841696 RepID=A0A8J6NV94_9BACT|nr:hypothetical protein [Candidatus Desulfatibia vada]